MILCCGEALIDMLPRRLEGGEDVFLPVPGGAVFNTAIALGRLGEAAGFFSGLSNDLFGRKLVAALEASSVDHALCARSDRPTTLAFVMLNDGQAQYAFHDDGTAGRMLAPGDLPVMPDGIDALHFGAISLIGEPCGSTYEALAVREQPHRVISLDPNIRPGFIDDAATYRARLGRMLALADIIKLSDEDLAWLTPGRDFRDAAGEWLAGNASICLLTRGGEGALALTRHGEIEVPAVRAEVVDTVGAGDTFNAGMLAGLSREGVLSRDALRAVSPDAVERALRLATRVAAVTVSRPGANPPWANELD